jgi:short-subunit dehydrogenase
MTEARRYALVTGASSGIGLELAKQFVLHDYDLVVCAEDAAINQAADALSSSGASVTPVQADLRTYEGVESLYSTATGTGRRLDAAALNAGVGLGGPFIETDLASELDMIDLNVKSTVHLAKRLLVDMVARNQGRVLITSSIASSMPGSFQSIYNASKSFLQSFAQAVQNELKDTDVVITSLMPGPTDTNFFHRADMDDTRVGQGSKDDPAEVAKQGFDALMDGDRKVVGGSLKTKAMAAASKVTPDALKAEQHRQMAEPGSAE